MRRKSADALAKQKAARQKKMVFILLPILLVLVVWQGPGMLKAFSGGTEPPPEAAPPPATATEPAASAPDTDPATGAAPTTAAGAPSAPSPEGAAALPETHVPPAADAGQLVSFDRFVGKDPFKQQVVAKSDDAGSSGGSGAGGGTGKTVAPPPAPVKAPASGGSATPSISPTPSAPTGGGSSERTSATIEVNGTREKVSVASTFPEVDPIFRVVSISAKSAKIELVTGEFSSGTTSLTLKLRKPLTLVSQPDGIRYVVTLLATGNGGP